MESEQVLKELQSGKLTDLHIKGDFPDDWAALAKAAKSCTLETLSLSDTKLTAPVEAALVEILADHALKSVSLEGLQISTTSSRALAAALPWTSLEALSLKRNSSLGPRGIKLWCEYLKKASKLYDFDCEDCGMGHFGAQAVGQVLPTTLISLNMAQNKLYADGIWKMANRFSELTVLQTLNLSNNQMGDDGCLELARNLSSCTSLEKLLLAGNDIADTGLGELIRILPQLGHLQILDLSINKLGNASAKKIGNILGLCGSLEVLDLSKNEISDSGCSAIVEGLLPPDEDEEESESEDEYFDADEEDIEQHQSEHSPNRFKSKQESHLRELHLESNAIGDEGAGSFVEHLDRIVALQTVTLENNPISDARMRILDMLLKHRTTISSPRKSFNPDTSFSLSEREEEIDPVEIPPPERSSHSKADDEADIAKGRAILLSASHDDDDSVRKVPMAFITHATDNWNRFACKSGAFGPLFSAIHEEEEESVRLVRKLTLSPAGKMEPVRQAVLAGLPKLRHDHVAHLMATSAQQGTYAFMYELPDSSSMPLTKYLGDVELRKRLSWSVRLHIASCIADTVEFLHKDTGARKAAIHGDLNPDTIYVSSDFEHVFLLDAGMSRLIATDRSQFAKGDVVYGTRGYRCPRYERGCVAYDSSSDVFSLGIVIAELMTSRLQRSRENKSEIGHDVYYDCYLARKPIRTDPLAGPVAKALMQNLGKLVLACLNPIPSQRPTAATISQILRETAKVHERSHAN